MPDSSTDEALGPVGRMRGLASAISSRLGLWSRWGVGDTFNGARNLDTLFGYKALLTPADYRYRYERGGIAGRIVDAYPTTTWRGEGDLVEDENPDRLTDFETSWYDLNDRLHIWATLRRADVLSQLGHYSVLLLGAPGDLAQPLQKGKPDELAYLTPISEAQAQIEERDLTADTSSPRYGMPEVYQVSGLGLGLSAMQANGNAKASRGQARSVHWTRLIHLADGTLDYALYASPRLMRCWNLLDCLDKVTGGGSEAFWLRAHRGLNLNLDKDIVLGEPEKQEIEQQLDEFENSLRRNLRTRGVQVSELGSDVADFSNPADTILTQIAGATGIPKRILTGSEAGQLASTQDRSNWRDQIVDRRYNYAGPFVARQLIDRCIEYGYLPTPVQYDIRWPSIQFLDDIERAGVASQWAAINTQYAATGQEAITVNEIRDRLLDLPPLTQLETPAGAVVTPSLKRVAWRRLRAQRRRTVDRVRPEPLRVLR